MALNNIDTQITANASKARKEVNNMRKDVNNLKNDTNSLGKSIIEAFKSGNIYGALQKSAIFGWIGAIKNATDGMIRATNAESDYAESLNLLNVAYDKNTESATKLISKMETMYGLDPAGLTKQLGIYKQITNAMGMSADASALLSENLLKMQEDVSSLYNLDIDVVASKFQSALAGQTRAVRSLGVDITQASLQQELYRLGIDRSVRDLNRASKTALIYISMQRQLQKANGDAANTVDHLANQVRIFKEQIAIAGRQIGAVFIPILSAVLPYLNGILMAINEIGKALLLLFHVDVNEMAKQTTSAISVAGGSVGGLGDSIDNVGNSLGGASKKAKDLKKELSGLRDFDKLNVITTPKDSSAGGGGAGGSGGGVGGGGLGGIDPDLMKWLKPYDLRDIAMEAERIKQAFLDWLKVFKPLEEPFKKLAGLTFDGLKYLWEEILKPVGKWANETLLPKVVEAIASAMNAVYEVAKTMQPTLLWIMENVVKPFGRVLGRTIINILDGIKTAFDAISKSKLLQYIVGGAGLIYGFTKLIGVAKSLYIWFSGTKLGNVMTMFNKDIIKCIKSTRTLSDGFDMFMIKLAADNKAIVDIGKLQLNLNGAKLALQGLLEAGVGLASFAAGLQDISENGFNLVNALSVLVGGIMAVKGAIEVTTGIAVLFGVALEALPIVALVTGLVAAGGLVAALVLTSDSTSKYVKELDEANKKSHEFSQKLEEEREQILKENEAKLMAVNASKDYVLELKNITDENGKVKQGYEDRAKFIVGQLNDAYGTEIKIIDGVIQKYHDQINTIDAVIKKKEAEIYLNIASKNYEKAMEHESELLNQLNTDYDNYRDAKKKLNEQQEKDKLLLDQLNKRLENGTYNQQQYTNALKLHSPRLYEAMEAEKKAKDAYYNTSEQYKKSTQEKIKYQEMFVAYSEDNMEKVIDINYNGVERQNELIGQGLVEQTRIIKDLGNNSILAAWKDLAENNVDGYVHDMSRLSSEQRKIISDATGVVVDNKTFAKAWKDLADRSEDDFLTEFAKLPSDIRQEVVDKMYNEGYSISKRLQEGINALDTKVKVGVKGPSNAEIQGMVNIFNNSLASKIMGKKVTFGSDGKLKLEADGGFLNTGEMFIAREAGPELVGRIGSRTAVANNDQIVNSIAKGLAMSGIGKDTNVTIVADSNTEGLLNFINFKQQQKNRQYGL